MIITRNAPAPAPAAPAAEPPPTPVRPVHLGGLLIGGTHLPVLAGPGRGAHAAHWSLREHHGRPGALADLERVRRGTATALVVEPFSAADLPAIREHADAVLVGAAWMQDFRLLAAVGRAGLPVVLQRGHSATLGEWLSAIDYLVAGGCDDVVLCEAGSRTHLSTDRPAPDLALVRQARERTGRPVIVDVSRAPELAAAAVAAGADGVMLAEDTPAEDVAMAVDTTTLLTPVVRPEHPPTLLGCRDAIDRVDSALATLLDYRASLAAEVQRHKPVPGYAGRDPQREAEIVDRMAVRAPRLGHEGVERIMTAVIEAGLDAAERRTPAPPA